MKIQRLCWLLILLTLCGSQNNFAQTVEHSGWLFWSHQQKLSERWQFTADVQIRSANRLNYVNTLLIRPGIGYKITDNQTLTLGYTYFGTWEVENDDKQYAFENRIFEQYQIENEIQNKEITNRIRYEQRFINQQNGNVFAQRLRYYVSARLPLLTDPLFTKGLYLSIQNEIFLNTQGKNHVNHQFFDQNRIYAGPGYRFNEKIDVETGYMFRYQVEEESNLRSHIFQVVVRTSF